MLYLKDLPGVDRESRRRILDRIFRLNALRERETHNPEITTRIAQYEMAYRMQTSVPGVDGPL